MIIASLELLSICTILAIFILKKEGLLLYVGSEYPSHRSQSLWRHSGSHEYERECRVEVTKDYRPTLISLQFGSACVAFPLSGFFYSHSHSLHLWFNFTRSFIRDWVSVGKSARLSTKAAAGGQSFETQCRHCEKVLSLFLFTKTQVCMNMTTQRCKLLILFFSSFIISSRIYVL